MISLKYLHTVSKVIVLLVLLAMLGACGKANVKQNELIEPQYPVAKMVKKDVVYPVDAYDPWEGFNRRMYRFNYYVDKYFLLPVVNTYAFIMPDFAEDGVSNFFRNLGEITNLFNSILQLKGESSIRTVGRFLLNSTIGIGGLFDPATSMGIHRVDEDFGQTLGHYGVGAGPYLVLPLFGPSSLRDATGLATDSVVYSVALNAAIKELDMDDEDEDLLEYSLTGLKTIDKRHRIKFRYYETGSPFEYEWVRGLYLQKRKMDVDK